ncbi:MAG: hypothetical protein KGI27_05670 [Thaumarchaeota archaeon]|nr:hypothetical protein [Nitrososphaerota archaeon]
MTNSNTKNRTKVITTTIATLVFGLVLLSPTTVLPSVHAVSTTHSERFVPLKPMSKDLAKKLVNPLAYADEVDVTAYDNNGNEYESIYVPDSASSTGYEWYGIYTPSGGSPKSAQADVSYPCDSYAHQQTLGVEYQGSGTWEMAFIDQGGSLWDTKVTSGGTSINTGQSTLNYGSNISVDSTANNSNDFIAVYHHINPTCPAVPTKH